MNTEHPDPLQAYIDKYEEPSNHINALLAASIVTLDIPARLLYPLAAAGVKTVGDLIRLYNSGLKDVWNIGTGAIAEIGRILAIADLLFLDGPKNPG